MQREIEALLAAYLADRNKEAQIVLDLMTALAVGSAGRQRMMQELAAAVGAAPPNATGAAVAPFLDRPSSPAFNSEVSAAVAQLRAARGANTH